MNITCPHCKIKLNIPDQKIPKGKDSAFKCPKCQGKVQVSASQLDQTDMNAAPGPVKDEDVKSHYLASVVSASQGREQALICMDDSLGKEQVVATVQELGFHVETPVSISEAFIKMAYHIYPLVLLDESFDQNRGFKAMSAHMNELDMSLRRRICLVLISDRLPTGDPMSALHASVNYIIGSDYMNQPEDILSTALREHQNFYTVYNESMKAVGKA